MCDINVYYNYLLAGIVQLLSVAAGIASLSWAPVVYSKSNWKEGGSKCRKYFTQFALFIVYIILISPRLIVLMMMAAVPVVLFIYIFVRWLTLAWFTNRVDNDVDFSSNLNADQKVFINVCRAALYVIIDINFTRNNPYRLFYSIGVKAIMLTEFVLLMLSMFYASDVFSLLNLVIFIHTAFIYPAFLWCVGS